MINFTADFCPGKIRRRNERLTTGRFHPLGSVAANPLRTGHHHPDFQQGLRRMGRTPGRHRHRLGCTGPTAPPQPRPQHPRRKLQAQRKTPGWIIPVVTTTAPCSRGDEQTIPRLTFSLTNEGVAQFQPVSFGNYRLDFAIVRVARI